MTNKPTLGTAPSGADAHHELPGADMATKAGASVHDHSVSGMGTRSGSDQNTNGLQGETALGSGTIATVSSLNVQFEQPDNSPPLAIPENVLKLENGQ
ncbi:MAG: hypothetical protein WCF85_21150, partial [Rhodospirillaceae bacterium]